MDPSEDTYTVHVQHIMIFHEPNMLICLRFRVTMVETGKQDNKSQTRLMSSLLTFSLRQYALTSSVACDDVIVC